MTVQGRRGPCPFARRALAGCLGLLSLLGARSALAQDDSSAAPTGASSESNAELHSLDVRLESGLLGRAFRYTDPLSDYRSDLAGQRPVDNVTPATPLLRLRVESFPLAAFLRSWPAHLGLFADLMGALPTNVRGAPSEPVQGRQSQGQLLLGGQAQIQVAALELTPRVGWGLHGWYLRLDDGSAPPFPDVTYSFVDVGLRLRGSIDTLTFEGDLGFRPGLSAGRIQSDAWFPNTTFWGMTTGASAGWTFHDAFTLRLHVEFAQYGLTFNPEVGRPPELVAGGATDQSVMTTLGLEWRLESPATSR